MNTTNRPFVLITGAGGMLAGSLREWLSPYYGVKFLSRSPKQANEYQWDIAKGYIDPAAFEGVEHLIHLSGVSIGEKRWTKTQKQRILESRVQSAALLLEQVKKYGLGLKSYISASAVGYYGGITSEQTLTESSPAGTDFLSHVCQKWEEAAFAFEPYAARVVVFRFGVMLSKSRGLLPQMIRPMCMHMGAVLGSGQQIMPWITLTDAARLVLYALQNTQLSGAYNAVAPQRVSNALFTHILARSLGKRVLLPAVPAWLLRLIFGQMSVLFLEGSHVSSQKLTDTGFHFEYPSLEEALSEMFAK